MEKFCVEMIEPGLFQSVFPSAFAEFGQAHSSRDDAEEYVFRIEAELKAYPAYCKGKIEIQEIPLDLVSYVELNLQTG